MKVLIAAGGSGGHIFPAIALAHDLGKKRVAKNDILFIGSNRPLDVRIFEKEGFRFTLLSSNKLPYGFSFMLITFIVKLFADMIRSFFAILSFRPDVVVGFGGYVPCPVILTAKIFGIPKILHEQNAVAGRANRLLFGLVDRIALSFQDTKNRLGRNANKAVLTGNPIRVDRLKNDKESGVRALGLDGAKFTVLVIGGSQGAHSINEKFINAVTGMRKSVSDKLQVVHITGMKDYDEAVNSYREIGIDSRVFSFIDRIEDAYSVADLVITRSGSSAIFEIAFFGKPMILVPYPFAMNHQSENARAFAEKGAAINIDEADLTAEKFKDTIEGLFNDKIRMVKLAESARMMSVPDASTRLADEVVSMGHGK